MKDFKNLLSVEERLELLMHNVKDHAIFFLDPDGIIIDWNLGAERILGYKENEIIGKSVDILFTKEDNATGDSKHELTTAAESGRAEDERWHVRKDGSRFWALGVLESLKDDKGKLQGFAKILRDFTERKKAEEAVAKKTEELERSNKELEQFAHIASHDLKSPLRTINNYLGLAHDNVKGRREKDKDTNNYLNRAMEASQRLMALIDDLLNYAKLGREVANFSDVDCATVVKMARRALNKQITDSFAEITTGYLPIVKGDEGLLVLLFQNLLENAIKYRRDEPLKIHIEAKVIQHEWLFSVNDNGLGIEPTYWEKIFQAFQRLYNKSQYPGTGIGLAICQKIVSLHGGRIWVDSRLGHGSTFFFTLPASASDK